MESKDGLGPFFSEAVKPQTQVVEDEFYAIPEGIGVISTLKIGGQSAGQLEAAVKATGREIDVYASDLIHSPQFEVLEEVTSQELLKLPVRALGLPDNPTTAEILERIPHCRYQYGDEKYALELPRAEVGPHKAIADKDQAEDDCYYIIHQPITDRDGDPSVFLVGHDSYGRFLVGSWVDPDYRWDRDYQLVVALRKVEPVKS